MCSSSAGFGRSSGAVSWHIRVFPRLVPRPVPRIIMVLLRVCVCVCVYFTRTFSTSLHSPHIPTLHCVWSQWCHLSILYVCVCAHTLWASEGQSILCKLEREWGRKSTGWQRMEGWRRERSAMEMIVCVCVCDCKCVFVCLRICPRAAKSAINLTLSWQYECVVVWHCVCVCVNWKVAGTTSSFTGSTLWSWSRPSVIWCSGVERSQAPDLNCLTHVILMLCW